MTSHSFFGPDGVEHDFPVDLEGTILGEVLKEHIKSEGVCVAPKLGVDFVEPPVIHRDDIEGVGRDEI